MAVLRDIAATYRAPGAVIRRRLAAGEREDRALIVLIAGCGIVFVSQWPRLAHESAITGQELNPLLGGALMAWMFIMPLVFYTLALLAHWGARVLGGKGRPFGARLALFWALLASSPLIVLSGLVAGYIGDGPLKSIIGALWLAVFIWFWMSGMRRVGWKLT